MTAVLGGYLGWVFFGKEDKRELLPGITTDGHHQIEQRCDVCHDNEPTKGLFTSSGVSNEACNSCHAEDLELANDSHPVAKFRNPENAVLLKHIDAVRCVTCHTEHLEEHTHEMAVSIPPDYCAHCHTNTLEIRESHNGLEFNTCETAGCHNYHDNTSLFESFLLEHAHEPAILTSASRTLPDPVYRWLNQVPERTPAVVPDAPAEVLATHEGHLSDWIETSHAMAGVNCSDCHGGTSPASPWQDRPASSSCSTCHDIEASDFAKGKHGMRLAADLSPMSPSLARLEMKPEVAHQQLDCVSCHGAHEFDRQFAAAEACITCHNDAHSRNFADSKHFALWQAELAGHVSAGTGVSCATCHMPREERRNPDTGETLLVVQHNQNSNLRPNEKMYRAVCMDCHGLPFTMDALSDEDLILKNFVGLPQNHVESTDWVLESEAKRQETRRIIEERRAKSKKSTQETSYSEPFPEKTENQNQN
ncbi:MAG: cytochrome c3 family protein [Verrucomicrobiota bacterium]